MRRALKKARKKVRIRARKKARNEEGLGIFKSGIGTFKDSLEVRRTLRVLVKYFTRPAKTPFKGRLKNLLKTCKA
jgi:hypothetical protein